MLSFFLVVFSMFCLWRAHFMVLLPLPKRKTLTLCQAFKCVIIGEHPSTRSPARPVSCVHFKTRTMGIFILNTQRTEPCVAEKWRPEN